MMDAALAIAGIIGIGLLCVALVLLDKLVDATNRIAEIMRRSHAADLAKYAELHPDDDDVEKTDLATTDEDARPRGRFPFQTM